MSSVPEQEKALILDLLLGRVAEDEFFRRLGSDKSKIGAFSLAMLERALKEKDPVGIEFGLYLGHHFGITGGHLDSLLTLAQEDWHTQHENVVEGLAKLRDPRSVDILYRVTSQKHPYLDYDGAHALGTKAIYALGAVQTPEAVAKLGELLGSENSRFSDTARGRLAKIADSGTIEKSRIEARKILEETK